MKLWQFAGFDFSFGDYKVVCPFGEKLIIQRQFKSHFLRHCFNSLGGCWRAMKIDHLNGVLRVQN